MKSIVRIGIILLVPCLLSCKKAIEKKQVDIFITAMTNGSWYIESYNEGVADLSTVFVGYDFIFRENGSLLVAHSPDTTMGTWVGNIDNYSITSDFPNAADPIKRLNGTWNITDGKKNYVEVRMLKGSDYNIIHLRKRP